MLEEQPYSLPDGSERHFSIRKMTICHFVHQGHYHPFQLVTATLIEPGEEVLRLFEHAAMKLKLKKSGLICESMNYLGQIIFPEKLQVVHK